MSMVPTVQMCFSADARSATAGNQASHSEPASGHNPARAQVFSSARDLECWSALCMFPTLGVVAA